MEKPLYRYEETGRSWLSIAILAFGCVFLAGGLIHGAPWYWYLPVGFFVAAIGWQVLSNPLSGLELNRERLVAYCGSWRQELDLAGIRRIETRMWTDGPPTVTAILQDSREVVIPHSCIGNLDALGRELAALGIPLKQA
jgi:hypothetical protein